MADNSLSVFDSFLPSVQEYIGRFLPSDWPEAAVWSASLTVSPGPTTLLPLASCAAVGGSPVEAVPLAAAWKVFGLAIRLVDDLQDHDRPGRLWDQIGDARAFNFASLLYAMCQEMLAASNWPAERHRQIALFMAQAAQRLVRGQERDLQGITVDIDGYWQMMDEKNATAFAFACQGGAMCGTAVRNEYARFHEYGHHLGMALQLIDDFQGFWEPRGAGDVAMNKVTLPVLVALEHPSNRDGELAALVEEGRLSQNNDRVHNLVERSDAMAFMLASAAGARDRALASLSGLPSNAGTDVLRDYVGSLLIGLDEFIEPTSPA